MVMVVVVLMVLPFLSFDIDYLPFTIQHLPLTIYH